MNYAGPGKVAVITGSSTGIGEALVEKLLDEGWRVYAGYHCTTPDDAIWHGRDNVTSVKCDISRSTEVQHFFSVVSRYGRGVDLLINNAGYSGSAGVIEAFDEQEYRKIFEINFWGAMMFTRSFVPLLRHSKGRIINICSSSCFMTIPMGSAYPVSKTALEAMTRHLRMELEPFGVDACAVHPGGVNTAMTTFDEELAEGQWASIPANIRAHYKEHFFDSGAAIGNTFTLQKPVEFADEVFRKVVKPKKIRGSYVIGPRLSKLLPLVRKFPDRVSEAIWRRLFRR